MLLDLDNNNFSGRISQNFGELENLEFLTIGNNDFDEQPLPEVFSKLTKLTTLGIQNSKLTGAIPATYGDLTNLGKDCTCLSSMKRMYCSVHSSIVSLCKSCY